MTTIQPADPPVTGVADDPPSAESVAPRFPTPGIPTPTARPSEVPGWRAVAPPGTARAVPAAVAPGGPSGTPPIHRPSRAARPVALAATFLLLASVVAGVALLIAGPPAPRGLPGVPGHPAPPTGIPDSPVDPRQTAPGGDAEITPSRYRSTTIHP